MVKRAFISDCEGPISKNDNAFEITSSFVSRGEKLFTVISRYDDALAEALKRPGYEAGCTLKLVLPFLKAYGVTDKKMLEFSAQTLVLIRNVKDTLEHVRNIAYAFIVSTSYEHYIRALCEALNFPYKDTYCTKVEMDKHCIATKEKNRLKELAKEISQMPTVEIPPDARLLKDFPEETQRTIERLDEIFWREIANLESGKIFSEVDPVGGGRKAEALKDAAEQVDVDLSRVIYVGDSITDVESFKIVNEAGGLTLSFNGNEYAVRNAEIAVLSENSIITGIIADVFCRYGKQEAIDLVENWSQEELRKSPASQKLLGRLFHLYPRRLPKVSSITDGNVEVLAKESSEFRKKTRGEAIGRLG